MKNLLIPAGKRTPHVFVDFTAGVFEIKGNSIPEDPSQFFLQVEKALEEYRLNPAASTRVDIFLNIFNTTTSKWLVYLLLLFKEFALAQDHDLIVNWLYEKGDEDSLEAGVGFKVITKMPLNLIETEPED